MQTTSTQSGSGVFSVSDVQKSPVLDEDSRAALALVADALVPAWGDFPSASEAGVTGSLLDIALKGRPDRISGLADLLATFTGADPQGWLTELQAEQPMQFVMLIEAVTGAYVLNSAVQVALGYRGQQPKAIDTDNPDYLDLLPKVIERGPIYRATPA
jgi:hypothetical protein